MHKRTLLPLTLLLSWFGLSACSLEIVVDSLLPTPSLTKPKFINFPVPDQVFDNADSNNVEITGPCSAAIEEGFLITSPFRAIVNCQGDEWTFPIDLNILPDGVQTIRLETLSGSLLHEQSFTKKFAPPHLKYNLAERDFSTLDNLSHSSWFNPTPSLVYVSNEACSGFDCNVSNIVLRLREDQYQQAYFATQNLQVSSYRPFVTGLPNSNDLRIYFSGRKLATDPLGVFSIDFHM